MVEKANIAFALPKSSLTGNVRVFHSEEEEEKKYSTKKKDIGFLKYNRSYCYYLVVVLILYNNHDSFAKAAERWRSHFELSPLIFSNTWISVI